MRYTTVEVDVCMDDFSDDDIADEAESRGLLGSNTDINSQIKELVTEIWHQRRQNLDYSQAVDQLIYLTIGRLIWLDVL